MGKIFDLSSCFPGEELFHLWQNHDPATRQEVWAGLWERKMRIGVQFCRPALQNFREGDELARDAAQDAFHEASCKVDYEVQSHRFVWKNCPAFNRYFKTLYVRQLIAGIRKTQKHLGPEVHFDTDDDGVLPAGQDSGFKNVRTKAEILAWVHYFSCLAELLRKRKDKKNAEMADAIVSYIKCEVARHTRTYAGIAPDKLPLDEIDGKSIEELLDDLVYDSQTDLGSQFSPQPFRPFLMRRLFGFVLSDKMRARYCEALGVSFTIRDKGKRRRITQADLVKNHKRQKRESPADPMVDEAFRQLGDYLRYRNLVDKRLIAFWRAVGPPI